MSNEEYLIVSYFLVGLFCCGLGLGVHGWLRRPFVEVTDWKAASRFARILRRLFPAAMIFPALAGFLSVSYRGCEMRPYEDIIASRAYLVAKNQEQISASMDSVAWAVLVWATLVTVCLCAVRRR